MEAGAISVLEVTLRNHEARINANHDSLATLREKSAGHNTKIEVITTELRETREDIGDMKRELGAARTEQKAEMTWVRRGLWAAAATFMLFVVALAGLIAQVAGG